MNTKEVHDEIKWFIKSGLIESYNNMNDEDKVEVNIDGGIYRVESFFDDCTIRIKYLREDEYKRVNLILSLVLLTLSFFLGYFIGRT